MVKENLPKAVVDSVTNMESSSDQSEYDNQDSNSVSAVLDGYASFSKEDAENLRLQILESASNNANKIYDCVIKEEESKIKWRKFFIIFFSALLVVSICGIAFLIVLGAKKLIVISDELIISLLIYIIANIFSILYFMVKYINNNQYLEMFKIVTHKMLDYIIQDKVITMNNHSEENSEDV